MTALPIWQNDNAWTRLADRACYLQPVFPRVFDASIGNVQCLPPRPSQKAGNAMHRCSCVHILVAKIVEDLDVQRPVMPLVGFVEIDRDLHCHRIWHFTREPATRAATTRTARNRQTFPTSTDAPVGSL